MKTFIEHNFPSLKRIDGKGDRTYQTPTGDRYPSVTSVVGLHKAKAIQEWRDRVGAEEANKISSRASRRGTSIHSLCENYLLGEECKVSPFDHEMFESLKPHLDKIDNIHCLETQLYSHHLEVAGTVDCIAEYEGKLCVIDFKSASKPKQRDWIHDYFMQTSAYAVMFEELTGVPVGRLLIVMGVDDHEPLIFQEKRNDWIRQFKEMRKHYKELKGQ
jgi:genome maintenance exonuclease 1